jgi:hypothetical protein
MALGLTFSAAQTTPLLARVVSSAQSFHFYFKDLKAAGSSLNPIERFVFSLVLANTAAPQTPPAATDRRT